MPLLPPQLEHSPLCNGIGARRRVGGGRIGRRVCVLNKATAAAAAGAGGGALKTPHPRLPSRQAKPWRVPATIPAAAGAATERVNVDRTRRSRSLLRHVSEKIATAAAAASQITTRSSDEGHLRLRRVRRRGALTPPPGISAVAGTAAYSASLPAGSATNHGSYKTQKPTRALVEVAEHAVDGASLQTDGGEARRLPGGGRTRSVKHRAARTPPLAPPAAAGPMASRASPSTSSATSAGSSGAKSRTLALVGGVEHAGDGAALLPESCCAANDAGLFLQPDGSRAHLPPDGGEERLSPLEDILREMNKLRQGARETAPHWSWVLPTFPDMPAE